MTDFMGLSPDLSCARFDTLGTSGVLLLDGDSFCYEASAGARSLPVALGKFKQKVLETMYLLRCNECRVHLTAKGSTKVHRGKLLGELPYQGNRNGKVKPPLLEPLRIAAAQDGVFPSDTGVSVTLHHFLEADDALIIDAYRLPKTLMYSPDKDLRLTPGPWYDVNTGRIDEIGDRYGWAEYDADKGKIVGHGTKFFWAQMLHGDQADNVKGLLSVHGSKCGQVAAGSILKYCVTEEDAANVVIGLYRVIDQNPLPEAYAMWLLRTDDDEFIKYLFSLRLTAANMQFIQDCWYNRTWRLPHEREESEEV